MPPQPRPGPRRARALRSLNSLGIGNQAGRGKAPQAAPVTFERLQRTQHDVETLWRLYTQSDEYFTFRVLVEAFRGLPDAEKITECRTEYEFILHSLNSLGDLFEVEKISKAYRAYYSPEVQLSGYLYSTLLTAFTLLPSYVLNGQEFQVSDTVLDQCQSLQFVFQNTCQELTTHFDNLQPYSLAGIRNDVKRALVYFDRTWCRFEMPALEEIEAIHRQACRPLIEAIEAERALTEYEQSAGGSTAVHSVHRVKLDVQRSRLMEKICALNRIANLEGHGRTDMDLTCFIESERLVLRMLCPLGRDEASKKHHCGNCVSPVVARVAHSLLRKFDRLRKVLQRHAKSLYQVNSHLANNSELVRAMERFEEAWELADRYLVRWESRRIALLVYSIVIGVKDQRFKDSLVSLDPEFLINVLPRTLLFHEMRRLLGSSKEHLENEGSVKGKKDVEGNTLVSQMLRQGSEAPMLPRPLDRTLGNGGNSFTGTGSKQQTPFERAAISRIFLPPEMIEQYNLAFASLKRLSEAQLLAVQEVLLGPAQGASHCPTPAGHAGTCSMPMHLSSLSRPSISSQGFTGPASVSQQGKNSGAATPCAPPGTGQSQPHRLGTGQSQPHRLGTGQSQPPQTPCPPRIAVPSTPQVHTVEPVAQSGRGGALGRSNGTDQASNESDDEEEEDRFVLDLALLQRAATAGDGLPPPPAGAIQESKVHDSAVAEVVAALGALSVHLQRAKAQEWNELIQVVLQGVHFKKLPKRK